MDKITYGIYHPCVQPAQPIQTPPIMPVMDQPVISQHQKLAEFRHCIEQSRSNNEVKSATCLQILHRHDE